MLTLGKGKNLSSLTEKSFSPERHRRSLSPPCYQTLPCRLIANLKKMEVQEGIVQPKLDHFDLDERLRPMVGADDKQYEALLDEVVTKHAMPLIKRIISSKLKVYPGSSQFNLAGGAEVDDLCQESVVNLISYLDSWKHESREEAIKGLDEFVAKIALNVYNSHLRRKYPLRHSLKRRILYQLKTSTEFELWKEGNDKIAGFVSWKSISHTRSQSPDLADLRRDVREFVAQRLSGQSPDNLPLNDLIRHLFNWIEQPFEIDMLVDVIARLQGVSDKPKSDDAGVAESNSGKGTPSEQKPPEISQIEQREDLRRIWKIILLLPVQQRKALLLNLKCRGGEGIVNALPLCEIASPEKIAQALEMKCEELEKLWDKLPLLDAQIGEMLGIQPQEVINLRKSARERLGRKIVKADKLAK